MWRVGGRHYLSTSYDLRTRAGRGGRVGWVKAGAGEGGEGEDPDIAGTEIDSRLRNVSTYFLYSR